MTEQEKIADFINQGTEKINEKNEKEKFIERVSSMITKGTEELNENLINARLREFEHHEIKFGYEHPGKAKFMEELDRQEAIKKADEGMQRVIDDLVWAAEIKKDMIDVEQQTFDRAVELYGRDEVRRVMGEVDNNPFQTLAQLGGFNNIMEWGEANRKAREEREKIVEDSTKKYKDDLLWDAQMDYFQKGK